jgi:hypothetical protein
MEAAPAAVLWRQGPAREDDCLNAGKVTRTIRSESGLLVGVNLVFELHGREDVAVRAASKTWALDGRRWWAWANCRHVAQRRSGA